MRPAFSKILPRRVVVVVLPLVPEMASISPFSSDEANSSSPTTGMPFSLAAFTTGASMGTPGLIIRISASSSSFTLSSPKRNTQAVFRRLSSWSPKASSSFISDKTGMAPWRSSSSAAAMPLRAMPTTSTRFFSSFMTVFHLRNPQNTMESVSSGEGRTERSGTKDPPQRSTWPRSAVRSCRSVRNDDEWATF